MMEKKQQPLLAAPQIEPTPSGTLTHSFVSNRSRTVHIGNIHTRVPEQLLKLVFSSSGCVEACKLIKEKGSSYGFIQYCDRRAAANAINFFDGKLLLGQPISVNWTYASVQQEDTSSPFNIFVGGLSPEVTNTMLFDCFSVYSSCFNARVIWDPKTGLSRGYGFVSFGNQQDAQSAINDLTGKWLGSRQIHCNWATKGAGTNDDDKRVVAELTTDSSEDDKLASENNPLITTVDVSNLAPEVTKLDLYRHFQHLGVGLVQDVWVHPNKGFGFVRYGTHSMAKWAIEMATRWPFIHGKPIKCTWGNKPTPPGTGSNPLPYPDPERLPNLSDMFINEHDGCCPAHSRGQLPLEEEEEEEQWDWVLL